MLYFWYFWWGCGGSLKLITLGSERAKGDVREIFAIKGVRTRKANWLESGASATVHNTSVFCSQHSADNSLFPFHLAMPDVTVKDITTDHEFIVLACDGKSISYFQSSFISISYFCVDKLSLATRYVGPSLEYGTLCFPACFYVLWTCIGAYANYGMITLICS